MQVSDKENEKKSHPNLGSSKRVLSIEHVESLGHKRARLSEADLIKDADLVVIKGNNLTPDIRTALADVEVDVIFSQNGEIRCKFHNNFTSHLVLIDRFFSHTDSIADLVTTGVDNARAIKQLRDDHDELVVAVKALQESNTQLIKDLQSERDMHRGVEAGVKLMMLPILDKLSGLK